MKITVNIDDKLSVDNVSTIIAEKLRQENIPFTFEFEPYSKEYIEWERELLSRPIIVGDIAIKVQTVRNKHFKLLDNCDTENKIVLEIEPSNCFGVGTHPTTQMCTKALKKHLPENAKVLDVGCGSGILSIVSLLYGAEQAHGIDIDGSAVKGARNNAMLNGVADKFTVEQGNLIEGVADKYNVVVANLLTDPIKQLLPNLKNCLAENGIVIISGVIDFRKEEVEELINKDFEIVEQTKTDNWCCYVLKIK